MIPTETQPERARLAAGSNRDPQNQLGLANHKACEEAPHQGWIRILGGRAQLDLSEAARSRHEPRLRGRQRGPRDRSANLGGRDPQHGTRPIANFDAALPGYCEIVSCSSRIQMRLEEALEAQTRAIVGDAVGHHDVEAAFF